MASKAEVNQDIEVEKVALLFNEEENPAQAKIREEISTCVRTGDYLWLAFDESTHVERLRWDGEKYTDHQSFRVADFLELSGEDDEEIDLEGLAYEDYYLWFTGSMSTKRDSPKEEDDFLTQAKDLAKIKVDVNRYTLGRIPCVPHPETGEMTLFAECPHPDRPDEMLTARQLEGGRKSTVLTKLLKKDDHLKPYMKIPSKDNGFDIEGLSVSGERIFIGLRGPVINRWAVILEIRVKEKKGFLKLKRIGHEEARYRKHFLDLFGMGIRELNFDNDNQDLILLAGPTMDLDGTISCWHLPGGLPDGDLTFNRNIERLFDIKQGRHEYGRDKAEGIAVLEDGRILVVYDRPLEDRQIGDSGVYADVFRWNRKQ